MKIVIGLLIKSIIVFTIYSTNCSKVLAQFEVVLVKGEVFRNNGKDKVQMGEKVNRDERFDFKSNDAIIAIYNSQVGRIMLPDREIGAGAMGGQAPKLRDKYKIVVNDLKQAVDANLFLTNTPVIDFGSVIDNMHENQKASLKDAKLFVRFDYNNQTVYNKIGELNQSSENIIPVARHQIYHTNGADIDPNKVESHTEMLMLCNDGKDTVFLRTFNPMYIDNQEAIKKEVRVIINANEASSKPKTETFEMVRHFISKYYGSPNEQDLNKWLKENFNFSI